MKRLESIVPWHWVVQILILFSLPTYPQLKYLGTTLKAENTGFYPLDGGREIIVTPDGKHVYVTAEISSAVGIFSRDARTGLLDSVGIIVDGVGDAKSLAGVRAIVSSPDGRNIYTSGQTDDQVTAFARDSASGNLSILMNLPIGGPGVVTGLPAASIAISPDGRHLYATEFSEGLLCLFARDTVTGMLQSGTCLSSDSIGGGLGLDGITSVTASPDGKHIYTTSNGDTTVLAFRRDSLSGRLSLLGTYTQGENGVTGLRGARSVVVSPDGISAYVVSETNHTIVTFSRNTGSGELTYREQYLNDTLLHWGVDLAVHPSGKYLYAIAEISGALSVYKRDVTTGKIEYASHFQLSPDSQRGLYAAYGVAVSPDGKHVYTLGWELGSLNFYEVVDTLVAPIISPPKHRRFPQSPGNGEVFTLTYSTQSLFRGYLPPVRSLSVKDMQNRTVFRRKVVGNRIDLPSQSMAGLPQGIYFLFLTSDNSSVISPWVKTWR